MTLMQSTLAKLAARARAKADEPTYQELLGYCDKMADMLLDQQKVIDAASEFVDGLYARNEDGELASVFSCDDDTIAGMMRHRLWALNHALGATDSPPPLPPVITGSVH